METPLPCSVIAVHTHKNFVFARVWLLGAVCRARGSLGPLPKAQLLSPYLYSATQGPLGQEKVAFVFSSQVYLSYYNVSSLKTLVAKDNWVLSVEMGEVTRPPFFSLQASKVVSPKHFSKVVKPPVSKVAE